MRTYRKTLDLNPDADYVYVDLGDMSYPFPNREVAERFAAAHLERAPKVR